MYRLINSKMYYNKANPVMCPYTRKQCMATCPLMKEEDKCFSFYCGAMCPFYEKEELDVQTILELNKPSLLTKIINFFKNMGN